MRIATTRTKLWKNTTSILGSTPTSMITERVSSAFCGDMTDQSRWILFGHKFPGPSFGMLAYCNKSYPVGVGALDDIGDLPLNLWRNNELEFRVRGGKDDYPWGDEYPHDPYFPSQFVSRSVLAGCVNGAKKKEFKFYDLERGSWPVITRQGILLLDRRKHKRRIAHEMFVARHSSMGECARAKSFCLIPRPSTSGYYLLAMRWSASQAQFLFACCT